MIGAMVLLLSIAGFANVVPEDEAEKQVLSAMETWRQAMIARDRATLERIFAPGLTYTHSTGKTENKAEAIDAVLSGKDRIESIDLTDTKISVYGKTALVKAKILMRINNGGAANTLNLDVLLVWMKNGSQWQMIARHALRLNP